MINEQPVEFNIDGNGNIVIYNVKNSTITINRNDTSKIQKLLTDFQEKLPDALLILLNEAMEAN